jgi:hypothetical protein
VISEDSDVVIRCADRRSVGVRFRDRFAFDADSVHFAVEAWAPGLTARVDEVVIGVWGPDLAPFLEGLAADFRGWEGERTWRTEDRDLSVSAVFRSRGHVGLTWTLRPWPDAARGWSASVTTWLEAGEQMSLLAADLRHFLALGRPGAPRTVRDG